MARGDFTRWMYRGQHPNWLARTLNGAWAAFASLATLEVTGRKSGHTISLPVVVVSVSGQRYLVSMLGEHVQWVDNVRTSSGRAVLRSGDRKEVQLTEIPPDQRASILKAYLQCAPGARPHIPVNKDASLAEFAKIALAFPVFPIVSRVSAHLET
jgi:deazaflavin-dependent oxidoreductase (nitroreductase family)